MAKKLGYADEETLERVKQFLSKKYNIIWDKQEIENWKIIIKILKIMIEFLQFLEALFGAAAIGCAACAVINLISSYAFPKSMEDEAWSYVKKSYIFLGLTLLFMVIGVLLSII